MSDQSTYRKDCKCICHKVPGTLHFRACCKPDPTDEKTMNRIRINDDIIMTRENDTLFVIFADGRIVALPDNTSAFQYPKMIGDLKYSQNVYEEGEEGSKPKCDIITIPIPTYLRTQELWRLHVACGFLPAQEKSDE